MPRWNVIFDLDGVIWRGEAPVPGAASAVAAVRRSGWRVAFCTNNSTLHRRDVAAKLRGMDIPAAIDDVVTSGSLAAEVFRELYPHLRPFVIGEAGLRAELEEAGITEAGEDEEPAAVIVGLDRALDFGKLRRAHRAVRSGARFLCTNRDNSLPETDGGSCPGCGALTALLEFSTGVTAECYGKPAPALFELLARRWGVSAREIVAVGDRLDTDIVAANRSGCHSVLVLSGVTSREEALAAAGAARPGAVIETLDALLPLLANEGWRD